VRTAIAALTWALLAAAGAVVADDESGDGDRGDTAEVAAGAETCVPLQAIKRTEIVDDRTVLFYMRGGAVFVNRLPRRCAGLKRADSFMYETSLSQLCNVDLITVLRRFGPGFSRGPSCGLGLFEPITDEGLALLREGPDEPEPEAVQPEIESPEEDGD